MLRFTLIMKLIAIQGKTASFHDIAAKQFFGDVQTTNYDLPFKNVFEGLKNADYAVVAIENSLYGSINEVYDLLLEYMYPIVGEIYLRIEHCLIACQAVDIQTITEVHSHPIALAQCEEYLDSELKNAERYEHFDTAGSVESVKTWAKPNVAAIASEDAAQLHNMHILAKNIETNKENYTRFVVLSKKTQELTDISKASLIIKTADKPGALHEALGYFAKHKLNLSKLESRPIVGKAWHYMFYIDVESKELADKLPLVINLLQKAGCDVQLLGSYVKTS